MCLCVREEEEKEQGSGKSKKINQREYIQVPVMRFFHRQG